MSSTAVMPADRPVDAHVHLWDPALLDYAWLAATPLNRRFDVDDLASAAGSAADFIVVQADCAPEQGRYEMRWLTEQARSYRQLRGIVAFAPLELGTQVGRLLNELSALPAVVGVRRLLQDEPAGFGLRPNFLAGLALLADVGLPFDVCVRESQLGDVFDIAQRTPQVQLVLDHLGKPQVGLFQASWRRELERLARLPNVVCKLSGLATEAAGRPLSAGLVGPYLRHALDVFGPSRCLFGSDWPVMTQACTYDRWLDAVRTVLDGYGAPARDQVLGETARRVYDLSDLPGSDRFEEP